MVERSLFFCSQIGHLHHPFGTANGDSEEKWMARLAAEGYKAMLAAAPKGEE